MFVKIKGRNTGENKARALAKAREKRRKKMVRTRYGQAPLKHSRKGVNSCAYAFAALILLLTMIGVSYVSKGKISILFGFMGFLTAAIACLGLENGVRGFRERDKNYITCKVGVAVNAVLLLGFISIFFRGLF